MPKDENRKGSDAVKRAAALALKEAKKNGKPILEGSTPDRSGRNIGAKGNNPKAPGRRAEHSRVDKAQGLGRGEGGDLRATRSG